MEISFPGVEIFIGGCRGHRFGHDDSMLELSTYSRSQSAPDKYQCDQEITLCFYRIHGGLILMHTRNTGPSPKTVCTHSEGP